MVLGPAWTRGEIERPAGTKNMGSWTAAVYTPEQQARLGVDEQGNTTFGQIEMPMELHEDLAVLEEIHLKKTGKTKKVVDIRKHGLNYVAGYLPGGNDLVSEEMTLDEAAKLCRENADDIIGITWHGEPNPRGPVNVFIKNKSCKLEVSGGSDSGWHCLVAVPVLYGRPSPDAIASAERGELILAGCGMVMDAPHYDPTSAGEVDLSGPPPPMLELVTEKHVLRTSRAPTAPKKELPMAMMDPPMIHRHEELPMAVMMEPMICGGVSRSTVDAEKCAQTKAGIEFNFKRELAIYDPVDQLKQVVAGTMYYWKVFVGDDPHGPFIFVKAVQKLPCNLNPGEDPLQILGVVKGKQEGDALAYF